MSEGWGKVTAEEEEDGAAAARGGGKKRNGREVARVLTFLE